MAIEDKKPTFYYWFINLFPHIILRNKIVSTIVDIVGMKLSVLKKKVDRKTNLDI